MKFCNKCGNKLTDGAKFCNKCGAKLNRSYNNNSDTENKLNEEVELTEINIGTPNNLTSTNIDIDSNNINDSNISDSVDTNLKSTTTENEEDTNQIHENNNHSLNKNISKPKTTISSKKKKRNYIIVGSIVVVILVICSALYFSKDSLLYKYYRDSANKTNSISLKVTDYNKALGYEYNLEISDLLYNTLKDDSSFMDELSKMTNLKEDDKNKLIYKLCTFKADESFDNGNYDACMKYLNIAKDHGYNIKDYIRYDDLTKKLNENKKDQSSEIVDDVYTFENKNPGKFDDNIYNYSGDFIMPNSDSTYLTEYDLQGYNKDTLALIRNEIFARHGYVFQTEPFKSYFNSKSWYTPNPSFKGDDSELNSYEIANIALIKKLEKNK